MQTSFEVSIPNLPKLRDALASYPAISAPIIQNAVVAAQAILAKYTTGATVPIRTGVLVQNWAFDVGTFQARWYPKAVYAPMVEFGTRPHVIEAKNASVLANKKTGQFFGKRVNHPGTKANPFMERIVAAAQPDIDALFGQALEKINGAIAAQSA
jgi:hypothetical protein